MHDLPVGQSSFDLHVCVLQRCVSMKTALGAHFVTHAPPSHASFAAQSSVDEHFLPAGGAAGVGVGVAVGATAGGFFARRSPAVAAVPTAPAALAAPVPFVTPSATGPVSVAAAPGVTGSTGVDGTATLADPLAPAPSWCATSLQPTTSTATVHAIAARAPIHGRAMRRA